MKRKLRLKRLRWMPGAVGLLLLLGSPGSALAKKPGVNPKPTVMLLLDSSTSMESSVDAVLEGDLPMCHESRVDGFSYSRSRWAVAVETLTGSFYDYWCSYDDRLDDINREDYNAQPNHVEYKGVAVDGAFQRVDGLIDIYRDQFKFGLMTFDPKSGITDDVAGGFSYGVNKSSGVTSNLGVRSESALVGRLVSPPASDNVSEVREVNDTIQEQILGVKPYSGTPLAPALEDALYFFQNDPRVRPYDEPSEKGDPYYDCRSKSVIFISDGQPNLGEGANGYPTSVAAAANLLAVGVTVYVVGFDLPAGTFPVLNEIAEAGGSDSAYIASSQAELTVALGQILVSIQGNQAASVNTVVSNRTLRSKDKQYHFNASYSGTMYTPLDQTGHLDQFVYRCDKSCAVEGSDGGASLCEVFSISGALADRVDERVVETQIDGELVDFSILNSDISADLLGVPTTGDLPQLDPYELPNGEKLYSGIKLGDASILTVREQYRQQLLRLIRADEGSRRENVPLGAINHAQPVVQTNLFSITAPIPSFIQYRNKVEVRTRPTVLFAGTHDGQMHAFRVDRLATLSPADYGEELWSFIPKHLLAKLNQLASGTVYLMDGEPVTEEVRLYKESLDLSLEEEVERWRSVLVSGYGQGGRGYFALNVTQPEEYEFMWEISNSERCYNIPDAGSGCVATTDFARLGNTYSRPAVGSLFFKYNGGTTQERSVAIFGGGGEITGEDESGKSLYVVDMQSGQLIREFCNSCGNVVDTNDVAQNTEFLDCPMIGDVVAYDTFPGAHVTRAFVGDACGQVWRLNLADNDPDEWKLEFFHDAFDKLKLDHHKRRPIEFEPAAATSFSPGRLVVVYATGSGEEGLTPSQREQVHSVSEYWDGDGFVAKENWHIELEKNETLSTNVLIFNSVAYFGTQISTKGLCAIGDARLWGIDFDGEKDNTVEDVVGAIDEDGDLLTPDDLVEYITLEDSELVGLQVTQRPTCFAGEEDFEPWLADMTDGASTPGFGSPYPGADSGSSGGSFFGGGSGGSLELVVQTGAAGDSSPEMSPPAGGGVVETGSKSVKKLGAPAQSIFSTSWGMVFD